MERPTVFISGVSAELRSFREAVKGVLLPKGIFPEEQTSFPPDYRTISAMLEEKIERSDAVICLIGDCCGTEPRSGREGLPRRSYTQLEYDLARKHGKPVYLFFAEGSEAVDPHDPEDAEKQALQAAYLSELQRLDQVWYTFTSRMDLERQVGALAVVHDFERRVAPTRLRHVAETLIGREEALARLDAAWDDRGTKVVVIRAWGGVGKTSLVAEWRARLGAAEWRGARKVFDWSFYSQGVRGDGEGGDKAASADVFIAEALRFFGDPDPQFGSPWDRGARLAGLVAKTKSLLVLDGLEPLQQPPGPLAGQLKDPAINALLRRLAQQNAGLCIVTTREKVTDLASFFGKTAVDWELEHLSEAAGAALLGKLGVQGLEKELVAASREVKGHALTLQLMGTYLAKACGGDVRKRDTFGFTEADTELQGGHAFRVLAAYERWLEQDPTHGPRMLSILRLLGLFDRPADPGCLAALRAAPPIPGLTEALAGLSEPLWNLAVSRLEELGLVSRVPFDLPVVHGYDEQTALPAMRASQQNLSYPLPEPAEFPRPAFLAAGKASSLEAHPLLREHFAAQMRSSRAHAWRVGHQRLFEHLQTRVPYWPVGLEGLQPLYQAVAHGCWAGLHQEACDTVYFARILRGTGSSGFYSMHNLGASGADLAAVSAFFDTPWSVPKPGLSVADHGWLLNEATYRLRALGRLTEALEPIRKCLQIDVERAAWAGAAVSARNLSELELTLGHVLAAAADGEAAVEYADRSADLFLRMAMCATRADALHQAGRPREATRLFEEAERLQAERQPRFPRLYGMAGFQYCDLPLVRAEREAWRHMLNSRAVSLGDSERGCAEVAARTAEWIEWGQRRMTLLDSSLIDLTIGRMLLYRKVLRSPVANVEQAVSYLNAAVAGLRQAGQVQCLPWGLLGRAWLRFHLGDEAGCRADLDEAWEIAERGPMRLFMADIQLYRARLFRDREALAEARKLIEQTGYHRRDEELADAEAALGVTGG